MRRSTDAAVIGINQDYHVIHTGRVALICGLVDQDEVPAQDGRLHARTGYLESFNGRGADIPDGYPVDTCHADQPDGQIEIPVIIFLRFRAGDLFSARLGNCPQIKGDDENQDKARADDQQVIGKEDGKPHDL